MRTALRRWYKLPRDLATQMADEINSSAAVTATAKSRSLWPSVLRWIPTSTDHIIAAEKRLLSLLKTPYVQEQVNIGSGPPGSRIRWFRSASDEPRFINTVTFDAKEGAPTLVMVHGYGASQGFFFRNFDALAARFRVVAIDQLGWGGSSRPDFTCKSTEETEAWFIDSFEEWRKSKNLSNFVLLGHSFGGYVAAKYALKHPEHVQHLILVGPAGFSSETEHRSEWLTRFRATWKGAILNHLWESNFTPQKIVRTIEEHENFCPSKLIYLDWQGPWGPDLVRKYTSARFGSYSDGSVLTEDESRLLTDYIYHTLAAKASGELCLKYIFSFGAFARKPLLQCIVRKAEKWKLSSYIRLIHPSGFIILQPDPSNEDLLDGLALPQLSSPCQHPVGEEKRVRVDEAVRKRGLHRCLSNGTFEERNVEHWNPTFGYSASEWKVPTTFIYGHQDWMNYQGAHEARKQMKVPCEIIRVPQVAFYPCYSDEPDTLYLSTTPMHFFQLCFMDAACFSHTHRVVTVSQKAWNLFRGRSVGTGMAYEAVESLQQTLHIIHLRDDGLITPVKQPVISTHDKAVVLQFNLKRFPHKETIREILDQRTRLSDQLGELAEDLDSTVGNVVDYCKINGVSDSPAVSPSSRSALNNQVEDLAVAINTNMFRRLAEKIKSSGREN
ncbi:hypothetical protein SASPL_149887 [Salvia splendens]|uniref:1-acylglycerol-3-phosphate O-acyltransferase n=1 Tax=Salvia splendens TaxID=180675 RepID=A0A8X8W5T3_SALSN|nr:hypothetical protein SASPL_149887 [Salvia splendens]